jgi:hypothetical protein
MPDGFLSFVEDKRYGSQPIVEFAHQRQVFGFRE